MTIGEKLKQLRNHLHLTQAKFSELTEIPLGTLKKYEGDDRSPSSEGLIQLKPLGVNLNWLLYNVGPMMLADLEKEPPPVDMDRLARVLRILETALDKHRRTLDPERKAKAVCVLYDYLYYKEGGNEEDAAVERFMEALF